MLCPAWPFTTGSLQLWPKSVERTIWAVIGPRPGDLQQPKSSVLWFVSRSCGHHHDWHCVPVACLLPGSGVVTPTLLAAAAVSASASVATIPRPVMAARLLFTEYSRNS